MTASGQALWSAELAGRLCNHSSSPPIRHRSRAEHVIAGLAGPRGTDQLTTGPAPTTSLPQRRAPDDMVATTTRLT